jgi:hypothetical protein
MAPRSVARVSGAAGIHGSSTRFSGPRFAGAPAGGLGRPTALSHSGRLGGRNGTVGQRLITNTALRSSFGPPRVFSGRFHGPFRRPWWIGGIAIGWVGPVFWPYAYDDFFDYVFWPYAYDDFWPYAYEDIYYGMYGSYGYVDPALQAAGRRTDPIDPERRPAGVCGENASELTNWPIERVAEVIEPNEAQRATLNELQGATSKAIDVLRAGCPNDLPSVPTGRLAAMESRLQVMLEAVRVVRAPLEHLYQSLSDEQKARFNAVATRNTGVDRSEQRDLAHLCARTRTGIAGLPIDRLARAVRPTQEQQSSLGELKMAAAKASERLRGNCSPYEVLTPTARVEAMEKRLDGMLEATRMVQPALTDFYNKLSDEQKARFNTLGSARQGA